MFGRQGINLLKDTEQIVDKPEEHLDPDSSRISTDFTYKWVLKPLRAGEPRGKTGIRIASPKDNQIIVVTPDGFSGNLVTRELIRVHLKLTARRGCYLENPTGECIEICGETFQFGWQNRDKQVRFLYLELFSKANDKKLDWNSIIFQGEREDLSVFRTQELGIRQAVSWMLYDTGFCKFDKAYQIDLEIHDLDTGEKEVKHISLDGEWGDERYDSNPDNEDESVSLSEYVRLTGDTEVSVRYNLMHHFIEGYRDMLGNWRILRDT